MPTRLCSTPGCPNPTTYRGQCAQHSTLRERSSHPNRRVYNKRRWRILRRAIIQANPICTHCHQAIATDADHITPISAGGAPYDPTNLQALCSTCHGKKTKREQA
jgi:5-methylcytosine-specific restriction protein A